MTIVAASTATRLTLIGAGPVGALLALVLARRGFDVDVWERRADMRRHDIPAGRSINLAVSTRGLHALHAVDLDDQVLASSVPMRGRMMHAADGALSFLPYGRDASEAIHSMSRADLNRRLMTAAEATGRVKIRFQQRLLHYDFDTQTAHFRSDDDGHLSEVAAPLVFGSDGSASALRTAMAQMADCAAQQHTLDSGYKELTIPPATGDGFGDNGQFRLDPNALHIWPRGRFMLIALPNRDGSFTCTLFLPFVAPNGGPSFESLHNAAEGEAFFARWFPDALPLVPAMGEALQAAPLGHMVTVRAWPWSRDGVLLVGDAAHAIVPFFGQGMNCGFEDCMVLDALLADAGANPDWPRLMATFAQQRKPDTEAIADMALENFAEMRDRVADPKFLLQRAVEAELQKRHPATYRSRYQLVTFSRVPYRVALAAGQRQAAVLEALCQQVDHPDQVDWSHADSLVHTQILPFLREHGALPTS